MVPATLLMFFFVLFAAGMVVSGVLSWPFGVMLGVALLVIERKLFSASHATDGDDASDEPHLHDHALAPIPKRPT